MRISASAGKEAGAQPRTGVGKSAFSAAFVALTLLSSYSINDLSEDQKKSVM